MARLLFPDEGSRMVYRVAGAGALLGAAGTAAVFYTDAGATTLADVRVYDGTGTPGAAYAGSSVTVDAYSRLPVFWGPDAVDTLYVVVSGGPAVAVYARADDRIDANTTAIATNTAGLAAEITARTTASASALTAANAAYASRYVGAATNANTARLLQKLKRGVADASILFIGDSTGNETTEWIYLTVQALAARFPAYTVTFAFWDEVGGAAYSAPTTIQVGTGAKTLAVYNCAVAGQTTGYALGARWTAAITATNPDLVVISHGHNQSDPTVTGGLDIQRNQFLSLTEEITAHFPSAGVLLVAQNPTTITGRETWQAVKADVLAELASLRGYGFLDAHQAFVDSPGGLAALMADTSHPNATGSALWAALAGVALTDAGGAVARSYRSPLTTVGRNHLTNGDFADWSGTDPALWVPAATLATTSKDLTNFETGTYGAKVTATAVSGAAYIDQTINLTTAGMKHLRGQVVTAAMRAYVPASNTATVRCWVQDSTGGANGRAGDAFPTTRDRFVWLYATKRLDAAATTVSMRCYARTSGTAIVEATVDRVYLVRGLMPECG